MKAAIAALKKEKIKQLVAAVPVAAPDSAEDIKAMVDEWVCLDTPHYFSSVGSFYQDFSQVGDNEVVKLLKNRLR
jgi:putative phosphoribosyl transferase